MTADQYRQTRKRGWIYLWLIVVIWIVSIQGIPSGLVPLWLFGVVTISSFITAWWLNLRLVTMRSRREAGRCWKCGYTLDGINATRCPECGVNV